MTLDGFFAVIAVLIGLYALAQPLQQKSIWIFFPRWLFFFLLALSGGILLWTTGMEVYGWECKFDTCSFILTILPLLLPMSAIIIVIVRWSNARISPKREKAFIDFIKTSRNENRYDELFRILSKNQDVNKFSDETIEALFEREIVAGINFYPEWLSLSLASEINELSKKKYAPFIIQNVIRDIVYKENSILQKAVASKAGGLDYLIFTEYEQNLLEKTILNPMWYIENRVDYDLLFLAIERIDSGQLDLSYNSNNNIYMNRQGQNTRISCPVFLFIELHSEMLEKAIDAGLLDKDYYVTDLYDVFDRVFKHFEYDENVWNSPYANKEAPTPYFYLLNLSLRKIEYLVDKAYQRFNSVENEMLERLINVWRMTLKVIIDSKKDLPDDFVSDSLREYLYFVLGVFEDKNDEEIIIWKPLLLKDIKLWSKEDERFSLYLQQSVERLDIGKMFVLENIEHLKSSLYN